MTLILFILLGVICLVLFVALLMKKEYSISSEIIINRPKNDVYNYVKYLRNQEKYSKWLMADPKIQLVNTGTDGTVGFKAAWTSEVKNVGVGEQEITCIREGAGYDAIIRFEKPFKGISYAHVNIRAEGEEKSRCTTLFETKTPFPMNILIPLIRKILQKDMDENSMNLKRNLEEKSSLS